jgi:hypothetical protein
MKCRQCGAEIADKALVCYKCGTATTEAKYKAPAPPAQRSALNRVLSVLGLLLLVVFALYMQRSATVGAPPALRWVVLVLAIVIVALRVYRRRIP